MGKLQDLTGQKFERLTVLGIAYKKHNKSKNGKNTGLTYFYKCKCDCGNETIVSARNLRTGNTKSCGCLGKEIRRKTIENGTKHNLHKTRLYRIWCQMKTRCFCVNSPSYKYYGGRGITVCYEWQIDFLNFYNWAINNNYSDNLSIDRINVDGNYEPNNCRWATTKEQALNKRPRKRRQDLTEQERTQIAEILKG